MPKSNTEEQIKVLFNYSIYSLCPNINKLRIISEDIEDPLKIRRLSLCEFSPNSYSKEILLELLKIKPKS